MVTVNIDISHKYTSCYSIILNNYKMIKPSSSP